ncbi:MAG: diaminopimelate epimerase [Lachnospiraceae bacterium]|nr:diaminopimelate epimerase [Lachnospiraceae bacterium]
MKFTKMHGCGNDYIYVNCMEKIIENPVKTAIQVSDRHFGIGSDGLILICPSDIADFRMEMYNADGSEGKMCGNGVRCIAKYVYEYGLTKKQQISVETKAGIKELDLTVQDGKVVLVKVNMGKAVFTASEIPVEADVDTLIGYEVNVAGKEYHITCVSMGNPHAVTFVEDTKILPLEKIGPEFEHHKMFPDRVNTEFVQVLNRKEVSMRVWERGSGETLACGTGACAVAAACVENGKTEREITVHLLGGDLLLRYEEDGTVWMTGPAAIICDGEIDIK